MDGVGRWEWGGKIKKKGILKDRPGQEWSLLLRVRGETLMGGKDGSFSHL